mgnify:CR=1 FL=1
MNRRALLGAILCTATAGTLLSPTSFAMSMKMGGPTHIETTLAQARALVPLCEEWNRLFRAGDAGRHGLNAEISRRVNVLLGDMLDRFEGDVTPAMVRDVLDGRITTDGFSEERAGQIAEAVIPVAVMRELIRTHRIPLRSTEVPNWHRFVERYRTAILAA